MNFINFAFIVYATLPYSFSKMLYFCVPLMKCHGLVALRAHREMICVQQCVLLTINKTFKKHAGETAGHGR